MPWWCWIVLGAVLLASELFVPLDFYLFFLGLAGLVVGAGARLGLVESATGQWALFAAVSVLSLLLFRRALRDRFRVQGSDPRVDDTLLGETAVVIDAIGPGEVGRAELRGSTWSARNADVRPLRPGERTRVQRVEGLTLHLSSDD